MPAARFAEIIGTNEHLAASHLSGKSRLTAPTPRAARLEIVPGAEYTALRHQLLSSPYVITFNDTLYVFDAHNINDVIPTSMHGHVVLHPCDALFGASADEIELFFAAAERAVENARLLRDHPDVLQLVKAADRTRHQRRIYSKSSDNYVYVLDKTPITSRAIVSHLRNEQPIGIILPEDSRVLVFDFDDHDRAEQGSSAEMDAAVVAFAARLAYPHAIYRSGGGHGYHVYLLFDAPVKQRRLASIRNTILSTAGLAIGTKGVAAGMIEAMPIGRKNGIALPCARESHRVTITDGVITPAPNTKIPTITLQNAKPGPKSDRTSSSAKSKTIAAALAKLDPNDYDHWTKAAHMLVAAHGKTDSEAYDAWVAWSKTAAKPSSDAELQQKWDRYISSSPRCGKAALGVFAGTRNKGSDVFLDDATIELLNEHYAIITDGPTCGILKKSVDAAGVQWHIMKPRDFYTHVGSLAEAAQLWVQSDEARRYPGGFVFDPSDMTARDCPGGTQYKDRFNIWQGWAIDDCHGDWSLMRDHIVNVLANGDVGLADYIIKWAAWSVQNPAEPAGVALVFRGREGTGKGVFARTMCDFAGSHGLHISNPAHLTGKFNSHLAKCVFLFADEAVGSNDKAALGALKCLLTEPTIASEPKGMTVRSVMNTMHVIMASNEEWVAPVGPDARRFVIADVSDARMRDTAYFKALYASMKRGGREAMQYDLLRMDLGDFHPSVGYHTAALAQQVEESEDEITSYVRGCLRAGTLPGSNASHTYAGGSVVPANHLMTPSFARAVNANSRGKYSASKIGRVLTKYFSQSDNNGTLIEVTPSLETVRVRCRRYILPPLGEARQLFDPHCDWGEAVEWEYACENVSVTETKAF